jgi:hypothetical protein
MKEFFKKIEGSFKRAMKGEEKINNVIWLWGAIFYVVAFFGIDTAIKRVDIMSFDMLLSVMTVGYTAWHVYILRKCAPKKPKLSKEEKKRLKAEARRDAGKRFLRKLFLKEPIVKSNPVFVALIMDLLVITHFLEYIL